jgi:hypothetical protein
MGQRTEQELLELGIQLAAEEVKEIEVFDEVEITAEALAALPVYSTSLPMIREGLSWKREVLFQVRRIAIIESPPVWVIGTYGKEDADGLFPITWNRPKIVRSHRPIGA